MHRHRATEQDHRVIGKPGKRLARPLDSDFVSSDSLLADSYLATGRGQARFIDAEQFGEPAIDSDEEPDERRHSVKPSTEVRAATAYVGRARTSLGSRSANWSVSVASGSPVTAWRDPVDETAVGS